MRFILFTLFLVFPFASLAQTASESLADPNIFRRAYVETGHEDNEGPQIIDPAVQGGLFAWQVILEDLFEPPLRFNIDGEIVPAAIDRWYYSDDGMSLFLELDPDKVWSDGEPVTASDYVFALRRMGNPDFAKSPPSFILSSIVGLAQDSTEEFGVEAESPTKLRIDMTSAYAITEPSLTEIGFIPLPEHKAPEGLVPWSEWPGGVTNGPYTLDKIEDDVLSFKRNPNAPSEIAPNFDKLETMLLDWPSAVSAFLSGNVDYLYGIPERQLTWFTENNIQTFPISARIYYYAMNPKFPGLEDKNVRRALRMAVDRKSLVKQLFPGEARPAFSIIPEGIRGYTPDPSLRFDDVDMAFEDARKLMEAAGYGPDNPLKIKISSNINVQHRNIAEFIKLGWSRIYVDAELDFKINDFATWFKEFSDGNYVVARRSWSSAKPLLESFMNVCKPLNDPRCGYYNDPHYEEVMNQAYAEKDIDKRSELFREADRLIVDADVIVPLFHGTILIALSDRLDTSWIGTDIRNIRSYELELE